MTYASHAELQEHLNRLIDAGQPGEALHLVETVGRGFPDEDWLNVYYRIYLLGMLGRVADAAQLVEYAIEAGYWYDLDSITADHEGFAPLAETPAFHHLREVSAARRAEARQHARPELHVEVPPQTTGRLPLMIALHGNNSNTQHTLPYWQSLVERGWLLALPQSSQIYGPQSFRWNDDAIAADELQAHYANLVVEYDIDPARVVVGGFSRGAGVGARAVLDGVIPARGFIAVAPVHPDFAGTSALPDLTLSPEQALRGYILLGEDDERYERHSRALVALMRRLNMPCILDRHEGVGHVYPPDFATVLQTAIDFVLTSTALP